MSLEPVAIGGKLDPALEFMRVLWALDNRLQSSSKRMAGELGVTGPQRLVVRMIGMHPSIAAGELATLLHLHKSTLTGVLQRLEARRVVRRVRDGEDGRLRRFVLTTEGERINRRTAGTVEAEVRKILAMLRSTDIAAARRVLVALSDGIDEAGLSDEA